MNRDFRLKATPALARKLARIAAISKTNVDPAILELAEQGLLTDEDFAGSELMASERQAVQSLIDNDFRAVLPGADGRNFAIALTAAKIAKIDPVVVYSRRVASWKPVAQKFGFTLNKDFFILSASDQKKAMEPDFIKANRHGLLITDHFQFAYGEGAIHLLVNDFPRTVILTETMALADLATPAGMLFPTGPKEVLGNHWSRRREMEVRGYTSTRPEDLAFMVNVVTDTMTFTKQADTEPVLANMRAKLHYPSVYDDEDDIAF